MSKVYRREVCYGCNGDNLNCEECDGFGHVIVAIGGSKHPLQVCDRTRRYIPNEDERRRLMVLLPYIDNAKRAQHWKRIGEGKQQTVTNETWAKIEEFLREWEEVR